MVVVKQERKKGSRKCIPSSYFLFWECASVVFVGVFY